jgi:hypothetical protein
LNKYLKLGKYPFGMGEVCPCQTQRGSAAPKQGERYSNALKKHEAVTAKNATTNLFERHLKPLLLGA